MIQKGIRITLFTCLFSLMSIPALAHSSMHEFAHQVHENLKNDEDFTLRLKVEGTLFHRGGEVYADFKRGNDEGRKCGELTLKGHGQIFREFKTELDEWEQSEHNQVLGDFFKLHEHDKELTATICFRLKDPNVNTNHEEPNSSEKGDAEDEY